MFLKRLNVSSDLKTVILGHKAAHTIVLMVLGIALVPSISSAKELLTLEASISAAKQFNLNFSVEDEKIRSQQIEIQRSQANARPVLSYTSDYEKLFGVQTLKNSVDLSWDLSSFASRSLEPQRLKLKAAKEHRTVFESQLVYQVKVDYYKLMRLKQELKVLQQDHQLLKQQRAITEQLVEAQLKLESALSRIDDRINILKAQTLVKQGAVDAARSNLLQLINYPDSTNIKFIDCNKEFSVPPKRLYRIDELLDRTPELRQMNLERQALTRSVHRSWVKYLPVASISTEYQQEWPQGHDGAGIHLVFTFPLSDMGRTAASNAGTIALAAKKRAEIKLRHKTIADRLNNLFDQAERSKAIYGVYQDTSSHLQQTLQLTKDEYQTGLVSEADLINVQKEASNAVLQANSIFYGYMTLVAEINYRMGAVE